METGGGDGIITTYGDRGGDGIATTYGDRGGG